MQAICYIAEVVAALCDGITIEDLLPRDINREQCRLLAMDYALKPWNQGKDTPPYFRVMFTDGSTSNMLEIVKCAAMK